MNQNENQVKSNTIVFDLCTISGEYQKENETKKSYHKIGTLFFKVWAHLKKSILRKPTLDYQ